MTLRTRPRQGLAVLSDLQGRLVQVVRDDLGVLAGARAYQPLNTLFAPAEASRVAMFLEEIQVSGAAFDWELHLQVGEQAILLYVAGGQVGGQLLVVGAFSRSEVAASFYEELMQINNEQMNALRASLKEQALLVQRQREREQLDLETYAELTRLNNELVALQREVSKTNAELLAQRERYRLISESISDYAYAYRCQEDGRLELEWMTGAFVRITGYQPAEIFGRQGLETLIHPQDREAVVTHYRRLRSGQPDVVEFRLITREGETRWMQDYGNPFWDEMHTRVVRIYGAVQDITERKVLELRLQEHMLNLETLVAQKIRELELERAKVIQAGKLAALGEMATGIAHELNQPLTALLLDTEYLEMLAQRALAAGESAVLNPTELLEIAHNQLHDIQRCRRIIDHLRTFGRLSNEPPVPTDLNQVLADALILTEQRLRQHNITLVQDLMPELPLTLAHPAKMEQVFLNLISNAEYALAERERQLVQAGTTEAAYRKTLELRTDCQGDRVCFSIRDNGCGMTPEQQKRLFEPFFTTKPVGQGTGLGLSISYGIVTEAGGQITCDSREHEGTTFTICLPIWSGVSEG